MVFTQDTILALLGMPRPRLGTALSYMSEQLQTHTSGMRE